MLKLGQPLFGISCEPLVDCCQSKLAFSFFEIAMVLRHQGGQDGTPMPKGRMLQVRSQLGPPSNQSAAKSSHHFQN